MARSTKTWRTGSEYLAARGVPGPDEGQIQFQIFVAMWLSRMEDKRHTFWPCKVWHNFNRCFRQSCVVWLKLENCFQNFELHTLASRSGKKSISP
jgi:hypothetical protein